MRFILWTLVWFVPSMIFDMFLIWQIGFEKWDNLYDDTTKTIAYTIMLFLWIFLYMKIIREE